MAFAFILALGISSCRKKGTVEQAVPEEDVAAKNMLQGVWLNEDEQSVTFKAKGDTIFYPDSTSMPVYFQILADTLVLHGAQESRYAIVKQTQHLFIFRNQNGDEVRCVKSDDPDDASFFSKTRPQAISLNQGQLIKRDTIVEHNGERYHCYVQVNPTTYKVVSQSYNDDGVAVDNIYYDNIINLNVYHGAAKLFGGDIRKQQLTGKAPQEFLTQGILSDLSLKECNEQGISFVASLIIPGASMSSYQVGIVVGYNGKFTIKTRN